MIIPQNNNHFFQNNLTLCDFWQQTNLNLQPRLHFELNLNYIYLLNSSISSNNYMPSKCIQLRPIIPFTVPLPFGNELQQLKSGFNFQKLIQKEPTYHCAISCWKEIRQIPHRPASSRTVPHRLLSSLVQNRVKISKTNSLVIYCHQKCK